MQFMTANMAKLPPFISVPLFLWKSPFASINMEAKLLYGMLLSRVGLSRINSWADEHGRIFVYFTIQKVMEKLSCGAQKASMLMKTLENHNLIYRKRKGCGKPYQIFPLMEEITDDNHEIQG